MILFFGDCLEKLKEIESNSIDALVTDPPAGIGFMNEEWDKDKGGRGAWIKWLAEVMTEVHRVLKPGAHGLVWAIPKTSHWTAHALEDAGFEIRDRVSHIFGSGFPKNMDLSKAIDKKLGFEPTKIGEKKQTGAKFQQTADLIDNGGFNDPDRLSFDLTEPTSPEAKQWEGWGTALKPAVEDWWLVRKPTEGSITDNVLTHGVGAINIDAGRIKTVDNLSRGLSDPTGIFNQSKGVGSVNIDWEQGRWPAHLILSHDERCTDNACMRDCPRWQLGDKARFFYCPKPTMAEKNGGLDDFVSDKTNDGRETPINNAYQRGETLRKNTHPTVKSIKLMDYMIRLITPLSGTVLDPFMGSGTTGVAAVKGGFDFVGIEQHGPFFEISKARIEYANNGQKKLL